MSETITLKHLHEDVLALRKEMQALKEKLRHTDSVLTSEDKYDLTQARFEYKNKKTKSLQQLEKEL